MIARSTLTPLARAGDPERFGGKAAQLSAALLGGLPVPGGYALDWESADAVVGDPGEARGALVSIEVDGGPWAVRSSAIGEDSAMASFAGAHATVLGVVGTQAVLGAIGRVHRSARDAGALAYRDHHGIEASPRMGVVVQRMVNAAVAGVLFTRHPVTGAAERVIEASWGLGELVVSGLVTPDHFRLDTEGRLLEHVPGEKDVALRLRPDGGTEEVDVPPERVSIPCLTSEQLHALHRLAEACDRVYAETDHDLEFAFAAGRLYLLQRRPITHG